MVGCNAHSWVTVRCMYRMHSIIGSIANLYIRSTWPGYKTASRGSQDTTHRSPITVPYIYTYINLKCAMLFWTTAQSSARQRIIPIRTYTVSSLHRLRHPVGWGGASAWRMAGRRGKLRLIDLIAQARRVDLAFFRWLRIALSRAIRKKSPGFAPRRSLQPRPRRPSRRAEAAPAPHAVLALHRAGTRSSDPAWPLRLLRMRGIPPPVLPGASGPWRRTLQGPGPW